MGVDFSKTFGANSNQNSTNTNTNRSSSGSGSDQPKAKIWLNVGYVAEGAGEGGEDRFVSLPVGIPLDTMEKLPTNSRNELYAQFQAARNDLYDQLMAAASQLQPGEDAIVGDNGGLCIQVRRVSEERAPIGVTEGNPFAKQLVFNG